MKAYERLLKYVAFDTQSNDESESIPSTEGQKVLGDFLVKEMLEIGISDTEIDDMGYIYGTIPANIDKSIATIGFVAHMDTAMDASGKNIKPRIIENYDGKDVILNSEKKIIMKTVEFPTLLDHIGKSLIVTDGTTLLGADNKAGIAEILTMAEYIITHPEIEHGKIRIAFTPDEEIGRGADKFDVPKFGAEYAYTVDGGEIGSLEYENFNAATATIKVNGISMHPGSSKGSMINANLVAMEFNSMLPVFDIPANTEGYEGFYHLGGMKGTVEGAELTYMIRDHSMEKFNKRKEKIEKIAAYINDKYPSDTIEVIIKDSYYNMKEKVEPHIHIIDNAVKAYEAAGLDCKIVPIRGGTDGARLSFMGLPCPNLCTGGYNFHGRYEYTTIEDMEKVSEILVNIVKVVAGV